MKIAVIGAGPGGLYAALEAAKRNITVDLFEKASVGEGICCGECIFDSLGVMPEPGEGLLHPVCELVLKGRKAYTINISRHRKLWMVDRQTWQLGLAKTALARGVRIHEKIPVVPARLLDMRREYDWIIDGSGAPSVASRAYHFSRNYCQDYLAAYQVVLKGDFSALLPRIKVGFFTDVPPQLQPAYYWIFPKNARQANVGVVCSVSRPTDRRKLNLKERLAEVLIEEKLTAAEVLHMGGGTASARLLPKLVFDNILLVGDAAGLTSALHGGGIDLACLSGVLAIASIIDGSRGADIYAKRLKDILRNKLVLEKVTIEKMKTLDFDAFDELLAGLTSINHKIRAKTALRHPDLLVATLKWLHSKPRPLQWPV